MSTANPYVNKADQNLYNNRIETYTLALSNVDEKYTALLKSVDNVFNIIDNTTELKTRIGFISKMMI